MYKCFKLNHVFNFFKMGWKNTLRGDTNMPTYIFKEMVKYHATYWHKNQIAQYVLCKHTDNFTIVC